MRKAEYIPFFVQTEPRINVVDLGSRAVRRAVRNTVDAYSKIRKAVLSRGADKQGLRMGR